MVIILSFTLYIELKISKNLNTRVRRNGVKLSKNGEIEVLATSVLNKNILKTENFKELYFQRWKIETYYEIIKNRLSLENFTGISSLAIKKEKNGFLRGRFA